MKKIYLLIIILISGCDQKEKDPINIDLLLPSEDNSIYYSKETNQLYSGPVFFKDENDKVFFIGSLINGQKKGDLLRCYCDGEHWYFYWSLINASTPSYITFTP